MKERPSWTMKDYEVRAILDGSKTQTRREVKPQPYQSEFEPDSLHISGVTKKKQVINGKVIPKGSQFSAATSIEEFSKRCPYGQVGDRLWVRENGWERPYRTSKMMREGADTWQPYYYDADGLNEHDVDDFKQWGFKRRPSIHMPRKASRITLEITGVRVERLQDISEEDAKAEGCKAIKGCKWHTFEEADAGIPMHEHTARDAFGALWESTNGAESWEANPWVWVIEFKKTGIQYEN